MLRSLFTQLITCFLTAALIVGIGVGGVAGCGGGGGDDGNGGQAGDGAPDVAEFSLGITAESDRTMFQVRVIAAEPAPPQKYRNDWVIEVLDMDGEPIENADLYSVQPFMPAHGHDGSFVPEVTAGEDPGTFSVGNINLWMGGYWEVRFFVRTGDFEDRAVVDVFIED